jgi:hypothetical protein
MQHKITSNVSADQLISVQNGNLEFSIFIEKLFSQPEIIKELHTCLKIINSNHGASPEIQNLKFTNVKPCDNFLTGTLSMVYELNLYWGCSSSSTVNRVETIWSFLINKGASTIELISDDDSERSTSEEF